MSDLVDCGDVVGPVWKLDGESWICTKPRGHDGDHEADGTWWTDDHPEKALKPR